MPRNQPKQQKPPPAPKTKPELGVLRFKADGSLVALQHHNTASACDGDASSRQTATVPTLRVDLRTSKIWVGSAPPLPPDSPHTLGVIGLLRLERGAILALVSKAKRVCGLLDGPVYKVEDTTLVAPEAINACDNDLRYASLLQEGLNPKNFGSHMYFSHTANLTSSRQRQVDTDSSPAALWPQGPSPPTAALAGSPSASTPSLGDWWATSGAGAPVGNGGRRGGGGGGSGGASLWSRADPRFVWNRELMRPLIEAGAEAFALPIMVGYIGQATGATFSLRAGPRPASDPESSTSATAVAAGGGGVNGIEAHCPGELTLITRLGTERPAAGGWRRGADQHGHTTGFAETEVLLTLWQPEETKRPRGALHDPFAPSSSAAPAPAPQPSDSEPPGGEAGGEDGEGGQKAAAVQGPDDGVERRRTRVAVVSYVILRGSAPLFWAAPPDLRPFPAPRGPEDPQLHSGPFTQHMGALTKAYGRPLLLVNLIVGANQGPQLRLHDTLARQAESYSAQLRSDRSADPPAAAPAPRDQVPEQDQDQDKDQGSEQGHVRSDGAGAPPPSAPGTRGLSGPPAPGAAVAVVGLPLQRSELPQLASCGEAAARLERLCAAEGGGRGLRAHVSLDELEVAMPLAIPTLTPGAIPAQKVTCAARHVACRQEGVVRVSSASTGSAGGCCEEVDLAQHALALPALAEALVAVGGLEDAADFEQAHTSVMHALARLWAHESDVLTDQLLGTASGAGRALQAAAADLEARGGGPWRTWLAEKTVRGPWRKLAVAGEAVSRYYYSNFTDARRQDALDLVAGAFKMSQPPQFVPRRQPPSTTSLQLGILLLAAALVQAILCLWSPPSPQELGMRVAGPGALGALLLLELLRRGATYVERPLLRTGEVFPWAP